MQCDMTWARYTLAVLSGSSSRRFGTRNRGARLLAAATAVTLAIGNTTVVAADGRGAPPSASRGGTSQQFRPSPDFFETAARTDARFPEPAGNATAVMAACLAGCYGRAGAGPIEITVHAYEVLTSANFAAAASVNQPVQTALTGSVSCVAGCSRPVGARLPARIDVLPAPDHRAVAQFKPGQRSRNVSRFAMTGNSAGGVLAGTAGWRAPQRSTGLTKPVRTALR